MHIVLLDDDLYFAARLAPQSVDLGHELSQVSTVEGLKGHLEQKQVDALLVNLGRDADKRTRMISAVKAEFPSIRILGFAGHKEAGVWKSAREAGVDLMVPNSTLAKDLTGSLLRLTRGHR